MTASNAIHVRLKQDHDALRIIMQRFAVAMHNPDSTAHISLLGDRVAFSQLFTRHMQDEQQSIAALDLSRLTPASAASVRARDAGIVALRRDYSAHINKWKPDDIARDQRGYAQAVLALQRRLKDCMALEENKIFPLLAQSRVVA